MYSDKSCSAVTLVFYPYYLPSELLAFEDVTIVPIWIVAFHSCSPFVPVVF